MEAYICIMEISAIAAQGKTNKMQTLPTLNLIRNVHHIHESKWLNKRHQGESQKPAVESKGLGSMKINALNITN